MLADGINIQPATDDAYRPAYISTGFTGTRTSSSDGTIRQYDPNGCTVIWVEKWLTTMTAEYQPNAFEGTTIPSNADISPIVQILKNTAALILTISVSLIYLVVYCLLATGTILLFIQRRWKIIVAVLLPIILLLYFPGPVSNSRFRIPTEPLMSIVVALALTETSLLRHKSPSDPPNQ